jgi:putative transposase
MAELLEQEAAQNRPGDADQDVASRLRIMNVGHVKVVLHRPLEGSPKTATLHTSSTGKWYVCFSCECAEPAPLPESGQQVGLDVGL